MIYGEFIQLGLIVVTVLMDIKNSACSINIRWGIVYNNIQENRAKAEKTFINEYHEIIDVVVIFNEEGHE